MSTFTSLIEFEAIASPSIICITFDDDGRLILEATSTTNPMIVSYDGQAEEQPRPYFKWILFHGPI
jgi:hypothetical protein